MSDYCEEMGLPYTPEDLEWDEHVTQKLKLLEEYINE